LKWVPTGVQLKKNEFSLPFSTYFSIICVHQRF
jgi:hypothetical protein